MAKRKHADKTVVPFILIVALVIVNFKGDIENFFRESWAFETFFKGEVPNYNLEEIPEYEGFEYVVVNENEPYFSFDDYNVSRSFEKYSNLDKFGRCGPAVSNIGKDLMPTTERGSIGMVKPSGWQTVKYDIVEGKYLYNRCHLIGYQLTGENANEKNLITCTRQTNIGVMLDKENEVAEYIKNTNNHVLYRVTPIFRDDELVARGILMEAKSVEDEGRGLKFNIFVYNVQDGIEIDYKTGESNQS